MLTTNVVVLPIFHLFVVHFRLWSRFFRLLSARIKIHTFGKENEIQNALKVDVSENWKQSEMLECYLSIYCNKEGKNESLLEHYQYANGECVRVCA